MYPQYTPELADRFWSRVDRSGECWVWTGCRKRDGYGQLTVQQRRQYPHRVAWVLTHGPIPAGYVVCHHCDNPPCCRPDHLFLGTKGDNSRDMARKGRTVYQRNPHKAPRGERHPHARLTAEAVLAIRAARADGVPLRQLAQTYGVSEPLISAVATRRLWKHVGG